MAFLKVQDALRFVNRSEFLRKMLNMRYDKYSYEANENKFSKSVDKFIEFLKNKLSSKEPSIILVDPQTRLEERIVELAKKTNSDFKSVKDILSNQIGEVESKLANSQQRLEDCLVEMSRKNVTNFEVTKEDSSNQLSDLEKKIIEMNNQLSENLQSFAELTKENFLEHKKAFNSLTSNVHNKYFENQKKTDLSLDTIHEQAQEIIKAIQNTNETNDSQFNKMTNNFMVVQNRMNLFQVELEKIIKKVEEIRGQMMISEYKLDEIEGMTRRGTLTQKLDAAISKLEDMSVKQSMMEFEMRNEKQQLRSLESKMDELLRLMREGPRPPIESITRLRSEVPRSLFDRAERSSRESRDHHRDDDAPI